jgi:ribose transport system permease protein
MSRLSRPARGLPFWLSSRAELAPVVVFFVALLVVYWYLNPALLTPSSAVQLSVQFLPLILASMAQAAIMLTAGIDLSIGAAISVATVVFASIAGSSLDTAAVALVAALAAGLAMGAVTGVLVAYAKLPPIIVTLATASLWSGVALFILSQPGGQVPGGLVQIYNGYSGPWPIALALIALAGLIWIVVRNTPFGMSIYAVGNNEAGAFAGGVNVRRTKIGTYTLAGLFTAAAGVSIAVQTGTGDPTIGTPYTLNSITAAVLGGVSFFGGVGEMKGAVLGALLLGILLNTLFFTGISPFFQFILQGALLVVAISLKALTVSRSEA